MANKVSVYELVRYLKHKNEQDTNLLNVSITGELSNVKIYPSQHMYFDLKDDKAKINGVMFASATSSLKFKPTDGDKVVITGSVKVYQNNATFQIIANKMEKDGYGALFVEFEKNKKLLEQEGYFDQKYKKPIPTVPNKIAVVAGHNSAALKDILTTLNNRFKLSQIVAFSSLVQGKGASQNLIETIELINKYDFDVILLARGGGSFEDLNAFNDVKLAKVIFNSKIPIVTGIGHEVDFTIADFVSDYRAETPTAAAIKVSPNTPELIKQLEKHQVNLYTRIQNIINNNFQQLDTDYLNIQNIYQKHLHELKQHLNEYKLRLEKNNIKYKVQSYMQKNYEYHLILNNLFKYALTNKKQQLESNYVYLNTVFTNKMKDLKQRLNENIIKLNLLDPNIVMDKGYAIVYKDDNVLKSYQTLNTNDEIKIVGRDGTIKADVKEVKLNGNK